jgi:hypothetical protein
VSAAHVLAEAVFAVLDAALAVPVHDAPPVDAALPYVVIGPIRTTPWRADDLAGEDHALSVHVWSRYRGAREVRTLMDAARAALEDADLAPAGHRLVLLTFAGAEDARANDGVTRHGTLRFRALTEPAAL